MADTMLYLKGVTKSYPQGGGGRIIALKPFDLTIAKGEIVALVGEKFRIGPVDWITAPHLWQRKVLV